MTIMTAAVSAWKIQWERTPTAVCEFPKSSINRLSAEAHYPTVETWKEMAQDILLNEIAQLRDGWDGGSAYGFASIAISNASTVLAQFRLFGSPPDLIFPSSAGTIEFEWRRGFGSAHLEIGNSTFGFYTEPNVGEPIMDGGSVGVLNVEQIKNALATIEARSAAPSVAGWGGLGTLVPRRAA
jgi:hypothetical protein